MASAMANDDAALFAARRKANRLSIHFNRKKWKPSSSVSVGMFSRNTGSILPLGAHHKKRLNRMLIDFVNQHKWADAAGVLSLLLKFRRKYQRNREHFEMALQVLREAKDDGSGIKKLFNIFYNSQPQVLTIESRRLLGEVQLELALYLMHQREFESAYNVLRPIIGTAPLRDNVAANLCYGIILHHLWYAKAVEEMKLVQTDVEDMSSHSGEWMPAEEADDYSVGDSSMAKLSVSQSLIGHRVSERDAKIDESTQDSSLNGSITKEQHATSSCKEIQDMVGFSVEPKHECFLKEEPLEEEEDFWENATMQVSSGRDRTLFPIWLPSDQCHEYVYSPQAQDFYENAVKHLKQSLSLSPHATSALLPLVQLLLAHGDIEGAIQEIEICYQASGDPFPLSIKARILESLTQKSMYQLRVCYEAILKVNPSCKRALEKLMTFHSSGHYATQLMIEQLILHLDVEEGSASVWQKLSTCFLEVKNQNPCGLLSVKSGSQQEHCETTGIINALRNMFTERNKWWKHKHFCKCGIKVGQQSGMWVQLCYKAACAAHIYGRANSFAISVSSLLKLENRHQLWSSLELHWKSSLEVLQ